MKSWQCQDKQIICFILFFSWHVERKLLWYKNPSPDDFLFLSECWAQARSCQYRPSWGRVSRDMIWLQGHTFAWLGPTWSYWGLHGHIVASMAVLGPTRSYWGLQGLNGAWIGAGAQGQTSTDSTGDCRALLALGNKENLANWTWKKAMMEKILRNSWEWYETKKMKFHLFARAGHFKMCPVK